MQATLLVATVGQVGAQTPGTGALTGRVVDPSGALVPNIDISVVSEETNLPRTVATNGEGVYRVFLLPPGSYSITVESNGFARETVHGVRVGVSETRVV